MEPENPLVFKHDTLTAPENLPPSSVKVEPPIVKGSLPLKMPIIDETQKPIHPELRAALNSGKPDTYQPLPEPADISKMSDEDLLNHAQVNNPDLPFIKEQPHTPSFIEGEEGPGDRVKSKQELAREALRKAFKIPLKEEEPVSKVKSKPILDPSKYSKETIEKYSRLMENKGLKKELAEERLHDYILNATYDKYGRLENVPVKDMLKGIYGKASNPYIGTPYEETALGRHKEFLFWGDDKNTEEWTIYDWNKNTIPHITPEQQAYLDQTKADVLNNMVGGFVKGMVGGYHSWLASYGRTSNMYEYVNKTYDPTTINSQRLKADRFSRESNSSKYYIANKEGVIDTTDILNMIKNQGYTVGIMLPTFASSAVLSRIPYVGPALSVANFLLSGVQEAQDNAAENSKRIFLNVLNQDYVDSKSYEENKKRAIDIASQAGGAGFVAEAVASGVLNTMMYTSAMGKINQNLAYVNRKVIPKEISKFKSQIFELGDTAVKRAVNKVYKFTSDNIIRKLGTAVIGEGIEEGLQQFNSEYQFTKAMNLNHIKDENDKDYDLDWDAVLDASIQGGFGGFFLGFLGGIFGGVSNMAGKRINAWSLSRSINNNVNKILKNSVQYNAKISQNNIDIAELEAKKTRWENVTKMRAAGVPAQTETAAMGNDVLFPFTEEDEKKLDDLKKENQILESAHQHNTNQLVVENEYRYALLRGIENPDFKLSKALVVEQQGISDAAKRYNDYLNEKADPSYNKETEEGGFSQREKDAQLLTKYKLLDPKSGRPVIEGSLEHYSAFYRKAAENLNDQIEAYPIAHEVLGKIDPEHAVSTKTKNQIISAIITAKKSKENVNELDKQINEFYSKNDDVATYIGKMAADLNLTEAQVTEILKENSNISVLKALIEYYQKFHEKRLLQSGAAQEVLDNTKSSIEEKSKATQQLMSEDEKVNFKNTLANLEGRIKDSEEKVKKTGVSEDKARLINIEHIKFDKEQSEAYGEMMVERHHSETIGTLAQQLFDDENIENLRKRERRIKIKNLTDKIRAAKTYEELEALIPEIKKANNVELRDAYERREVELDQQTLLHKLFNKTDKKAKEDTKETTKENTEEETEKKSEDEIKKESEKTLDDLSELDKKAKEEEEAARLKAEEEAKLKAAEEEAKLKEEEENAKKNKQGRKKSVRKKGNKKKIGDESFDSTSNPENFKPENSGLDPNKKNDLPVKDANSPSVDPNASFDNENKANDEGNQENTEDENNKNNDEKGNEEDKDNEDKETQNKENVPVTTGIKKPKVPPDNDNRPVPPDDIAGLPNNTAEPSETDPTEGSQISDDKLPDKKETPDTPKKSSKKPLKKPSADESAPENSASGKFNPEAPKNIGIVPKVNKKNQYGVGGTSFKFKTKNGVKTNFIEKESENYDGDGWFDPVRMQPGCVVTLKVPKNYKDQLIYLFDEPFVDGEPVSMAYGEYMKRNKIVPGSPKFMATVPIMYYEVDEEGNVNNVPIGVFRQPSWFSEDYMPEMSEVARAQAMDLFMKERQNFFSDTDSTKELDEATLLGLSSFHVVSDRSENKFIKGPSTTLENIAKDGERQGVKNRIAIVSDGLDFGVDSDGKKISEGMFNKAIQEIIDKKFIKKDSKPGMSFACVEDEKGDVNVHPLHLRSFSRDSKQRIKIIQALVLYNLEGKYEESYFIKDAELYDRYKKFIELRQGGNKVTSSELFYIVMNRAENMKEEHFENFRNKKTKDSFSLYLSMFFRYKAIPEDLKKGAISINDLDASKPIELEDKINDVTYYFSHAEKKVYFTITHPEGSKKAPVVYSIDLAQIHKGVSMNSIGDKIHTFLNASHNYSVKENTVGPEGNVHEEIVNYKSDIFNRGVNHSALKNDALVLSVSQKNFETEPYRKFVFSSLETDRTYHVKNGMLTSVTHSDIRTYPLDQKNSAVITKQIKDRIEGKKTVSKEFTTLKDPFGKDVTTIKVEQKKRIVKEEVEEKPRVKYVPKLNFEKYTQLTNILNKFNFNMDVDIISKVEKFLANKVTDFQFTRSEVTEIVKTVMDTGVSFSKAVLTAINNKGYVTEEIEIDNKKLTSMVKAALNTLTSLQIKGDEFLYNNYLNQLKKYFYKTGIVFEFDKNIILNHDEKFIEDLAAQIINDNKGKATEIINTTKDKKVPIVEAQPIKKSVGKSKNVGGAINKTKPVTGVKKSVAGTVINNNVVNKSTPSVEKPNTQNINQEDFILKNTYGDQVIIPLEVLKHLDPEILAEVKNEIESMNEFLTKHDQDKTNRTGLELTVADFRDAFGISNEAVEALLNTNKKASKNIESTIKNC